MTIKNNFSKAILIYYYKNSDTVYLAALSESIIKPGSTGEYRDDSFPQIKISIRDGKTIFDKQLIKPGKTLDMSADYIFTSDKKLVRAKLDLKEENLVKRKIKSYEFFDARKNNVETKRTVASIFQNAYSQSSTLTKEFAHSQTWSVDGEVGAWIGGKDATEGGSAKISVGFQDQIKDSLQNNYEKSIKQTLEKSTTDQYTFQPGFVYVIEAVWEVTLKEGKMSYLDEELSYAVIKSADGSLTKPQTFNSPGEMPDEMKKRFEFLSK